MVRIILLLMSITALAGCMLDPYHEGYRGNAGYYGGYGQSGYGYNRDREYRHFPPAANRPPHLNQRRPHLNQRPPQSNQRPPQSNQRPPHLNQRPPQSNQRPSQSTQRPRHQKPVMAPVGRGADHPPNRGQNQR